MKMKTLTSALLVTVVLLNFIITGCGKDDNATIQKDTKTNTQTQQQAPPPTQSNNGAPKIGLIWTQIEKKSEALGKVIESKKAPHLDEPIAEIINLLKTLPGKSAGLEQSKLDAVKMKITELEKTGITMDEFQHNKKDLEVVKEFEKFKKVISEVKSQYPTESFN